MSVGRHGGAEGFDQSDVAEGVFDVVVAANHMGDALGDVVDDVGEMKHRVAVGPHDDEILHVGRALAHVPFDHVAERQVGAGHFKQHGLAFAGAALVEFVGAAGREQFFRRGEVHIALGGLVHRLAVGGEPEPFHRVQHGLHRFRGRALAVGVLHAQQEDAAVVAREQPVVDRGTHVADVDVSGRTGSKAASNSHTGVS